MRKNILTAESEKHESYGIINFSRVSATPPIDLFGSSIKHGNFITMKVSTAERSRDFQKDWIRDKEMLIEVEMSATQFADAITSFNVGCGVPVTLKYVKGDTYNEKERHFRETPPAIDFKARAQGELKEEMSELAERINDLAKDTQEILKRKGTTIKANEKEKLLKDIQFLIQEVQSNIPFAHECFNQAIERTVTEAKSEVDATYQTIREKLGDMALQKHLIETPLLNENKD